MRNRFEQQFTIGLLPIEETEIDLRSRDPYVKLMRCLKEIFVKKTHINDIFHILDNKINKGKKQTGRKGMNLWQIFVLSQVRLGLNLSYDRLHTMANNDRLLRQVMGIETQTGFNEKKLSYQSIIDNISLLDEATLRQINYILVSFGHEVYNKKQREALGLKTDSFIVRSNVHFPTDYNLLWDSARKCHDFIKLLTEEYPQTTGWRKLHDWNKSVKSKMRSLGKECSSAGKGKEERVKKAAKQYITKAKAFLKKIEKEKPLLPCITEKDVFLHSSLEEYMMLLLIHIDLAERRLIKSEKIPHCDKYFSIFEQYTQMIKKGKLYPDIELGKSVAITTDQFNLMVDFKIMEDQTDSEVVIPIADEVLARFSVSLWSFDKGFYSKMNKELLQIVMAHVIMPKKGKLNKQEKEQESQPLFKKSRNKHSAVESNINELQHCGLSRCPDRSYEHFKRYIALGVCAYNLRKIGAKLMEQDKSKPDFKSKLKKAA